MAKIKKDLEQKIRIQAKNRCGYCLNPQELMPYKLEIEHILPKALGGTSDEENLWLACRECNSHKAKKIKAVDPLTNKTVKLFNPRRQRWKQHFEFSQDGEEIIGKTPCGRATIKSLKINSIWQKTARLAWIEVGWFPPMP
ncbi:MAG TPA: HNH endonuclease signature motif containing protein [Pyrinomonadaceae bacterium]|jgi:CO dehydrogenase/acetyl-CoA synthase alpha subunit